MTHGCSFAALTALLSLSQVVPASGADLGPLPADGTAHRNAPVVVPFDIAALKANWRKRIEAIKANGLLPIIDIESSFNSDRLNLRRGEMHRDVNIPINGPSGHDLFSFAEKTGIPFQIHYEIEDTLLPALEEMLRQYPKAKVIWCHLAQIRYASRSTIYGPGYLRKLIETFPNLYFDVAFGGPASVYPGSGERHARVWDQERGGVKKEWVELITQYPRRFLAALDLGGDRQDELPEYTRRLRSFLDYLPEGAREIVAYRAAWKLLLGEEL